jgi:TrpR-related protein YerC/YecD
MTIELASRIEPSRDQALLARNLCEALLTPGDPDEMARLLADLCTPAEVRTLAERWHVARLLEEGKLSYREIHDATGVSTTTIVRVARFLRQEPHQAYRVAMRRIEEGAPDAR